MHQLWSYRDYVDHLTHSSNLVRRWAFEAIEERFSRRYTKGSRKNKFAELALRFGRSD